jgi:hypothetical protein
LEDDDDFKIEKGIPLPEAQFGKGQGRPGKWATRFEKTEVGDSFLLTGATLKRTSYLRKVAEKSGRRIALRVVEGGVRVWIKELLRKVAADDGLGE